MRRLQHAIIVDLATNSSHVSAAGLFHDGGRQSPLGLSSSEYMANRSALRSIADAPWSHPRAWPTARAASESSWSNATTWKPAVFQTASCERTASVSPVLVGFAGATRRRRDVVDEHPAARFQRLVKAPHERGIVDPEVQEPAHIDSLFRMNVSVFESILGYYQVVIAGDRGFCERRRRETGRSSVGFVRLVRWRFLTTP